MEADIVPQFMRGKNIAQTMMRSTSGESFFCYCEPFASCHSDPQFSFVILRKQSDRGISFRPFATAQGDNKEGVIASLPNCHCERSVAISGWVCHCEPKAWQSRKNKTLNTKQYQMTKTPITKTVLNLDIRICSGFSAWDLGFPLQGYWQKYPPTLK